MARQGRWAATNPDEVKFNSVVGQKVGGERNNRWRRMQRAREMGGNARK